MESNGSREAIVSHETSPIDRNTQEDKENDSTEKITPRVKPSFKIWFALSACLICYVVSLYGMVAISTQYFSKRIAKDKYDFDYTNKNETHCDNASNVEEKRINKVQKDVSELQLKFAITTNVPALIVSFLVGSYSDFLGRKPLLLVSTIGGFLKVVVLCLVVAFETDLNYFYIGAFLDGLVGSYFTTVTAVTSIIADITVPSERAVKFAIIEGILLSSVAVSQIGIGVLITSIGYLTPCVVITGLFLLVIALVIFLCPETSERNKNITKNPVVHFKRVFGFYLYKGSTHKRPLYLLGITIFFISSSTSSGKGNVEVLFETSYPLCWNALDVGMFTAIRLLAMAAVAVAFLKVTKKRLSLEVTGVICAVSATAGFVVEGFARNSLTMFISALVGVLYLAIIPIPRALLSQLASVDEQGALFSSLSSVDVLASTMSSALFTVIYNSSIDSFKGAIFMAVGCLCVLNSIFLLIFRYRRRATPLPIAKESMMEVPNPSKVETVQKVSSLNESSALLKNAYE